MMTGLRVELGVRTALLFLSLVDAINNNPERLRVARKYHCSVNWSGVSPTAQLTMNEKPQHLQVAQENVTQGVDRDRSALFCQLWDILGILYQKVAARFQLQRDLSLAPLEVYSAINGSARGSLHAFSGSEIDWLVHGCLYNPMMSFSTMRLTVWLGPSVRVPHLTCELGTVPQLFFYMDYIPRTELSTDLDYLNRYYQSVNQTFLQFQDDPKFSRFVSKSAYIRAFQSPSNLCYTCAPSEQSVAQLRTVAVEMLDRWLQWVDAAEKVPTEARASLAQRDLFLRRSSAESDPGNQFAAQLFGTELTDKLVRGLWGGDRMTPRCVE